MKTSTTTTTLENFMLKDSQIMLDWLGVTCLHITSLSCFIRELLATPTGTDEKEKFEIEKESAWLQFWIWKIIFISHWWWWWWWGEMWKWGSEINKFCKNFFVLSLDHRWAAAAATGNIVVVVDFSIVHSRWWSFLYFHGKHKRSLEITFFCYVRASRSKSADKTRSFFH